MYGSHVMYYAPKSETTDTQVKRSPAVDIIEKEDTFELSVNLAGVKKENILIKVEEQTLVIGAKSEQAEVTPGTYVLRERYQGDFQRKFKLSNIVDTETIDASYENGVLNITLHKKPESQPKSINIK